jgi:hypothetical protein
MAACNSRRWQADLPGPVRKFVVKCSSRGDNRRRAAPTHPICLSGAMRGGRMECVAWTQRNAPLEGQAPQRGHCGSMVGRSGNLCQGGLAAVRSAATRVRQAVRELRTPPGQSNPSICPVGRPKGGFPYCRAVALAASRRANRFVAGATSLQVLSWRYAVAEEIAMREKWPWRESVAGGRRDAGFCATGRCAMK